MSASNSIEISSFGFIHATEAEVETGLLGWLTLAINDALQIDGVTLRRTRAGEFRLSYPEPRDRHGVKHTVVRPLHDEARRDIETQVFKLLGLSEESAR